MPLNIVTALEPLTVENIIVFIYGDPGIWKTSLAFTAASPILFDFDGGAHRAGAFRKDTVRIGAWGEVANFTAKDLEGYDTIIIDTAGRALDLITDMLRLDRKNTRRDGELSMQGYGKLASIFTGWLKMLRGMGKDIILLAHTSEEKNGDDIIKRPDMVGSSKREVYKIADMMGYMTIGQGVNSTVRMLSFQPHPSYLAKDSGRVGNIQVKSMSDAPSQMADIIQSTKNHINSLSAEALKAQQDLDEFREKLMDAVTANDYNDINKGIDASNPLSKQMKRELFDKAESDKNIRIDKEAKKFVDVTEESEAEDA